MEQTPATVNSKYIKRVVLYNKKTIKRQNFTFWVRTECPTYLRPPLDPTQHPGVHGGGLDLTQTGPFLILLQHISPSPTYPSPDPGRVSSTPHSDERSLRRLVRTMIVREAPPPGDLLVATAVGVFPNRRYQKDDVGHTKTLPVYLVTSCFSAGLASHTPSPRYGGKPRYPRSHEPLSGPGPTPPPDSPSVSPSSEPYAFPLSSRYSHPGVPPPALRTIIRTPLSIVPSLLPSRHLHDPTD